MIFLNINILNILTLDRKISQMNCILKSEKISFKLLKNKVLSVS